MEFKFSCKWFEISFSGDPGAVQNLLDKYEPYVTTALKQVEEEIRRGDDKPASVLPPPAHQHPAPPPSERQPRAPEQTRPWERDRAQRPDDRTQRLDDRGNRADDRFNRRDDRQRWRPDHRDQRPDQRQDRRDYSGPQRDQKKNESAPVPVEVGEELTRASLEGMSSDIIYEALNGRSHEAAYEPDREPGREAAPAPEPPPREAPPAEAAVEEKAPPAAQVEFPVRRRTPRIEADELSKIMDKMRPRTHHDRVMVFGWYMEQEAGGSDFTIPEIKRCYQAVNQDAGQNIDQVINHATRSGFIVRNDKGRSPRFKLSSKGRRYVEDGLKLA